jgi:arylsulfatase A-like enzyme
MLHKAGYRTVFAGKYLNGYPFSRGPFTPPGWDDFHAFDRATPYYRYTLVENRKRVKYGVKPEDYSTHVLTQKVVAAIRKAKKNQPLFVEFAPNAPHRDGIVDPVPAPGDAGVCADTPFPLPANFNASDEVGEPPWMAGEIPKSPDLAVRLRRATCETLRGVDRSVSAIFAEIARTGRLADTYVVFTSDNGFHFGEHRLWEKGDLYDESVRVPLLVRGPGVVAGSDDRLTSNIDLAPTFLDWAHVTPPKNFFDGRSFAASARGKHVAGPTAIVLRGCRTGSTPSTGNAVCGGNPTHLGKHWGLRTARYKYIEYPDGYRQLFDLAADPGEVHNLGLDPAYAATRERLHERLVRLRGS